MGCLLAVVIVLSLLSGWSCAQAPGDGDSFCTETLPSIGVNILDYPPEVKPLMDSRHYQALLPPSTGAVWQTVDNDNNNPSNTRTNVSCYTGYILLQGSHISAAWHLEMSSLPCILRNTLGLTSFPDLPIVIHSMQNQWGKPRSIHLGLKCWKLPDTARVITRSFGSRIRQWEGLGMT